MPSDLAIDGGHPVRSEPLPYGRQFIDETDIQAVIAALRSNWLTTGPAVNAFEQSLRDYIGSADVVAVSNGTAALHAAMYALDIGPGDEVIVPTMTFAATANCVAYQGGTPIFADVDPRTLLIDIEDVAARITAHTRAVIAVDYAGQPCDYTALRQVTDGHGLALVADAAHSIGGGREGRRVGTLADLSTFSFHPVKHVTTGEGGAVSTHNAEYARRMRTFRNHGITVDHRQREATGAWFYEMVDLGFNYRITDIQCALGCSQLAKLPGSISRRREIAAWYDRALTEFAWITPLGNAAGSAHAYHLYVVRVDAARLGVNRDQVFRALRGEGIGVNVHYVPVHLHPYYQTRFGTARGQYPVAESAYAEILTLPMFPQLTEADLDNVIEALRKVDAAYRA